MFCERPQLRTLDSQQITRLAMIEQRNPKRLLHLREPARDRGDIAAEFLSSKIATVTWILMIRKFSHDSWLTASLKSHKIREG